MADDPLEDTAGFDLDDQMGEASDVDEAALDETVADFEVQDSFVELGGHDTARIDQIDPELHHVNVRKKLSRAQKTVNDKFTQLIIAGVASLIGIALALLAITWQTQNIIIAASVVCPPAFFITWSRYNKWVARKNSMYRLLETLGEDVSDLDPRTRKQRRQKQVLMQEDRSRR